MKLSKIYEIADQIAPKRLSDNYCKMHGAYDNSGLLVEASKEIHGILFTLDLTNTAIDEAIEKGADLIITHHPVIYGKLGNICMSDEKLLGEKLVRCLKNGISIISMHLNLDMAVGGTDESLMQGIYVSAEKTTGAGMRSDIKILSPVDEGGYGRCYEIPEISLGELVSNLKKEFQTERIITYGNLEDKITRVASFCGAGGDEEAVLFAKREGADVVLSADFKHHVIMLAQELGLSVIAMTHYASEQYGFKNYYKKICQSVDVPCVYHTDEYLL